ncbi:unnamed protein product [Candidula unifasciata]|uniref:Uncharacterized protein n=1 Tax=Candidula unifasciata TaxID=100452 RepID=A0A8S3ZPA3_9EUPU|nr:unnamed protein product [Candidula unifasciata]
MKSLLETSRPSSDYSVILGSDFLHEQMRSKLDENDPNMNCYSDFSEMFDAQTCQDVQAEIEAAIQEAADKKICSQMIYPPDLVSRITSDVLRLSVSEPCGLRGCAIYMILQEKDRAFKLGTIFGNPLAPPTFEIHLTLKEDDRSWKKLQKVYYTIRGCLLNSQWSAMPKILCSSYHLEKRRLYRRSDSVDSVNT